MAFCSWQLLLTSFMLPLYNIYSNYRISRLEKLSNILGGTKDVCHTFSMKQLSTLSPYILPQFSWSSKHGYENFRVTKRL